MTYNGYSNRAMTPELRTFLAQHMTDGLPLDDIEKHYAYSLPTAAVPFGNHTEVRRALEAAGSHFYDRAAVRFFQAKTSDPHMSGRRFWVESARYSDDDPRMYQVSWVSRYVGSEGTARLTVERLDGVPTLADARKLRNELSRLVTRNNGRPTGS